MRRTIRFTQVALVLIALLAGIVPGSVGAGEAHRYSSGYLAAGTVWATPYYIQDSEVPGPTVLIVGGVHGDEPAGARAAADIRQWRIERGRLIVVPQANRLGLQRGTRGIPGVGDLNRHFPRWAGDPTKSTLARAIWNFTVRQRPDWLADLHEGWNYYRLRTGSVGNSIIYYPSSRAVATVAWRMKYSVDRNIGLSYQKFSVLRYPVSGSLARAAAIRLGTNSMILETAVRGQGLATRAFHHRVMAYRLLWELRMVDYR